MMIMRRTFWKEKPEDFSVVEAGVWEDAPSDEVPEEGPTPSPVPFALLL